MNNTQKTPFMITLLLAFGAWLSALAAFFFFALTNVIWFGAACLALAAFCARLSVRRKGAAGVFAAQSALAFSLLGKFTLVSGLGQYWNLGPGGTFALTLAVVAAGYPWFRQKADRIISVCAALCAGIAWPVLTIPSFPTVLLETCAVAAFVGAYILLLRNKEAEAPFAWALLGACAFSSSIYLSEATFFMPWLNPLLLGAALCVVYAFCVRGRANGWIMAGILLLCLLGNTGIVMGCALIALGFAQKRLAFKIIGAAAMYASLIWLYYSMHATLLVKSYYLGAAGFVLLGAYAWLKKGEKNAQ